jgi:ribosome assembly protein YihI (activator of Der GTPase)
MIEGSQTPKPHTIQFETTEYIDRVMKVADKDLNARCEKWALELAGLRNEWRLEHRNLIERYETSERLKEDAKTAVDDHFKRINDLQVRMDKLQTQFVTSEQVDRRIKTATVYAFSIAIALIGVLGTVIVALIGKL